MSNVSLFSIKVMFVILNLSGSENSAYTWSVYMKTFYTRIQKRTALYSSKKDWIFIVWQVDKMNRAGDLRTWQTWTVITHCVYLHFDVLWWNANAAQNTSSLLNVITNYWNHFELLLFFTHCLYWSGAVCNKGQPSLCFSCSVFIW